MLTSIVQVAAAHLLHLLPCFQGEGVQRRQQQWLGRLLQRRIIRQQRFIQLFRRQRLWKLLFLLLVLLFVLLVLWQLRLGEQQRVRSRTSKEEEEEEMSLWLSTWSLSSSPICNPWFFFFFFLTKWDVLFRLLWSFFNNIFCFFLKIKMNYSF